MFTGIREKTIVKEGGKIEVSSSDLPVGTEVEVIVLIGAKEMDETDYLLSTEANRKHLEQSMLDAQNPKNLIHVDIDNL